LAQLGQIVRPRPRFAHGSEATVGPYTLLGTFHPSQQNTFTGRLTRQMFVEIFVRARELAQL
jgi:uracil-DNA glycosylase